MHIIWSSQARQLFLDLNRFLSAQKQFTPTDSDSGCQYNILFMIYDSDSKSDYFNEAFYFREKK